MADWETGPDDAGDSQCFSCGNELVAVCSETSTVIWGKPINEIAKECVGWFRDAAGLVGESEAFIGKGKVCGIPSAMFGGDTRSAGCPYGSGTVSTDAGERLSRFFGFWGKSKKARKSVS